MIAKQLYNPAYRFSLVLTWAVLCTGILLDKANEVISIYQQRCQAQCKEDVQESTTCSVLLPRHYITHHLNGKVITVDGRLDEVAWKEVPWTENFLDIRGSQFPTPPVNTRAKIRWDDQYVYVAAYIQEPHVWATYTQKDTRVYQENAFEVFLDVDNSMSIYPSTLASIVPFNAIESHRYKEIEINALGTTWDLIMSRAYMDGGDWEDWEGIYQKAVYTDGVVNNASVPATFWSVEISFPFSKLSENTTRSPGPAVDGEMWFMELARPRYTLETLKNDTYEQNFQMEILEWTIMPDDSRAGMTKPGTDASWYAWSPTGAVNLHLPSKWGLLFFTKSSPKTSISPDTRRWKSYQALFDIFNALTTFKAERGTYVDILSELNLGPYITAGNCFSDVAISLNGTGFEATVVSNQEKTVKGHITQDRHLWFSHS